MNDILDSRLNATHPNKERYKKLIRVMPEFSLEALRTPHFLVDYGIWASEPKGWKTMIDSPRYFAGRQVLAKHFVKCHNHAKPGYMELDFAKKDGGERFVTHKALIKSIDKA